MNRRTLNQALVLLLLVLAALLVWRIGPVRQALGELESEGVLLLAAVEHLGRRADAMADRMLVAPGSVDTEDARAFMGEFQASKLHINRLAASSR